MPDMKFNLHFFGIALHCDEIHQNKIYVGIITIWMNWNGQRERKKSFCSIGKTEKLCRFDALIRQQRKNKFVEKNPTFKSVEKSTITKILYLNEMIKLQFKLIQLFDKKTMQKSIPIVKIGYAKRKV